MGRVGRVGRVRLVRGLRRLGGLGGLGRVGQVRQVGQGENCELDTSCKLALAGVKGNIITTYPVPEPTP